MIETFSTFHDGAMKRIKSSEVKINSFIQDTHALPTSTHKIMWIDWYNVCNEIYWDFVEGSASKDLANIKEEAKVQKSVYSTSQARDKKGIKARAKKTT